MAQNLDMQQPLPFGFKRNRLAEFLATDVLVAAGSATLITPAVMIFDRLVVTIDHLSMIDKIYALKEVHLTDIELDWLWKSHL